MSDLDEIDHSILYALQADGRISNVELADQCGLSPSSTLERVRRLERTGVILGYAARIDSRAMGHQVVVFIHVTMREHGQNALVRFEEAVNRLPEILECHHVTGEYDYLLKGLARDVGALRNMLVEKLSALPGVARIQTNLVLSTGKHMLDIPALEGAKSKKASTVMS